MRFSRRTHTTTSRKEEGLKGTGLPCDPTCSIPRKGSHSLPKGAGQRRSSRGHRPSGRGWEEGARATSLPPAACGPPVGGLVGRGRREARARAGPGLEGRADSPLPSRQGVSYVDVAAQGLLVRHLLLKDEESSRGVGANAGLLLETVCISCVKGPGRLGEVGWESEHVCTG